MRRSALSTLSHSSPLSRSESSPDFSWRHWPHKSSEDACSEHYMRCLSFLYVKNRSLVHARNGQFESHNYGRDSSEVHIFRLVIVQGMWSCLWNYSTKNKVRSPCDICNSGRKISVSFLRWWMSLYFQTVRSTLALSLWCFWSCPLCRNVRLGRRER